MIYATLDADLADDPSMVELEFVNGNYPWWYVGRVIQLAKRANRAGKLYLNNGNPVTAKDLAIAHQRDPKMTPEWQQFLDICVTLDLLEYRDGCYQVTNWRRWHRAPSAENEAEADRKRRQRKPQNTPEVSQDIPDTSVDIPEVSGHVTNVPTQSRAKQSKAEHEQSKDLSAAKSYVQLAEIAPEKDLGGGRDDQFLTVVRKCHSLLQQVGFLPCTTAPQVQNVVAEYSEKTSVDTVVECLEEAVEHVKSALVSPREPGQQKMRSPSLVAFRRWQNNLIATALKRARAPDSTVNFVEPDPNFEWEA